MYNADSLESSNNKALYGTMANNINDSNEASSVIVKSDCVARGYFTTIDSYNNLDKQAKIYVILGSIIIGSGLICTLAMIFEIIFGERTKYSVETPAAVSLINIFAIGSYCLGRSEVLWNMKSQMKEISIASKNPCSSSNSARGINNKEEKKIVIAFENQHGI